MSRHLSTTLKTLITLTLTCFACVSLVQADEQADAIAEMQRKLNAEVMEKPFSVEDEKKIDAYVKEAMAKDLKPEVQKAPSYWRPGYTCANIYSHGWRAYRNCRYYHRYYGRYW